MAHSMIGGSKVGRKQTGRFACKYHTSWVSLKPQSAEDESSFPGSKLLMNSPYRICDWANLAFVYGQLLTSLIMESANWGDLKSHFFVIVIYNTDLHVALFKPGPLSAVGETITLGIQIIHIGFRFRKYPW